MMLHTLLSWDAALFQWINTGWSNPVFDVLLPLFRERLFWAPLYLFLAAFLILNFGGRSWMMIVAVCLAVGLADFTSSTLIKKNVQRVRPCNDPALVVKIRVSCGSGYSFTSSHAANHFAVAVFVSMLLGRGHRGVRPLVLTWAGMIALSQVYVGVHYPLDVLGGGLLGAAIGWWAFKTLTFFMDVKSSAGPV